MYHDKTLVVAGCSHTYGTYLNFHDADTAHQRSWVKKLEQQAGFKDSVNLAIGGASNKRSIRVITEFVVKNIANIQDYVIMIGLTELSRTELPSLNQTQIPSDFFFDYENQGYWINMLGNYCVDKLSIQSYNDFLKLYYGLFSVDKYDVAEINNELFRLHTTLKYYNAEHYFPIMLGSQENYTVNTADTIMPYISKNNDSMVNWAKHNGFKVGRDIDVTVDCNHFDHDGNEFIASEIYQQMKDIKNGI